MSDKKIYLVGIGTGVYEGLTIRAAKLVNAGDLLFGAERMLKAAEGYQGKRINAYQPEEICRCLKSEENRPVSFCREMWAFTVAPKNS